jgi:hypothetical protein
VTKKGVQILLAFFGVAIVAFVLSFGTFVLAATTHSSDTTKDGVCWAATYTTGDDGVTFASGINIQSPTVTNGVVSCPDSMFFVSIQPQAGFNP